MSTPEQQYRDRWDRMTTEDWAKLYWTGIPPPITPEPLPTGNPIVDTIQLSFWRKQNINLRPPRDRWPDETLVRMFDDVSALKQKLGTLLLDAMTASDLQFAKVVHFAIGQADEIFGRTCDRQLLAKVQAYCANDPRFARDYSGPVPTVGEYRKEVEVRFNNGKKLDDRRWRRLRAAMFPMLRLKPGKAGRKPCEKLGGKRKAKRRP